MEIERQYSNYSDADGWFEDEQSEPIITHQASMKQDNRIESIEESKIEAIQKKCINQVVESLGLPESIARGLLLKFNWSPKKVENKFLDDMDLLKN